MSSVTAAAALPKQLQPDACHGQPPRTQPSSLRLALAVVTSFTAVTATWHGGGGDATRSSQTHAPALASTPNVGGRLDLSPGGKPIGSPVVAANDDVFFLYFNESGVFLHAWRASDGALVAKQVPLLDPGATPNQSDETHNGDPLALSPDGALIFVLMRLRSLQAGCGGWCETAAVFAAADLAPVWVNTNAILYGNHQKADAAVFVHPRAAAPPVVLVDVNNYVIALDAHTGMPLNRTFLPVGGGPSNLAIAASADGATAITKTTEWTRDGSGTLTAYDTATMAVAASVTFPGQTCYTNSHSVWTEGGRVVFYCAAAGWADGAFAGNLSYAWARDDLHDVAGFAHGRAEHGGPPVAFVLSRFAEGAGPTLFALNASGGDVAPPLALPPITVWADANDAAISGTMLLAADGVTVTLMGGDPASSPPGGVKFVCVRLDVPAGAWTNVWASQSWGAAAGVQQARAAPRANGSIVTVFVGGVAQFN